MRILSQAISVLFLGGGLCAGVFVFGPTGPAHPATPLASARHQLVAPELAGTRLCLDVPGGSTAPGKQLKLDDCRASAPGRGTQHWVFVPIGTTGHYRIRNAGDALCLGLQAGEPFAGNAITQSRCGVAPWWDVTPVKDNSPLVYIKEAYYNLALTANSAQYDKNHLIAEPIRTSGPQAVPDAAQVFQFGGE